MRVSYGWSALLALIMGIAFTFAFYGVFEFFFSISDTTVQIFLSVICAATFFRLLFFGPLKQLTQDDSGGQT